MNDETKTIHVPGLSAYVSRNVTGILSHQVHISLGPVSVWLRLDQARSLAAALLECADATASSDLRTDLSLNHLEESRKC